MSAIYPIHDKDSQNGKNKDELTERHLCLWECVAKSCLRVIIVDHIIPSPNVAWLGIVLERYDIWSEG